MFIITNRASKSTVCPSGLLMIPGGSAYPSSNVVATNIKAVIVGNHIIFFLVSNIKVLLIMAGRERLGFEYLLSLA